MATKMMVTPVRGELVILLTALALALTCALLPSQACALHCYVADKPNGAGAATDEDIQEAG